MKRPYKGTIGVHLRVERKNHHGDRKNSRWHHWSKYAQRLGARCPHSGLARALPEFENTAVSTSRQETADETAKHFGVPHAFADPYKMVQHPDVDLVSICVRVPFHHQLGMAALNAGKHLYWEWPLAATTEQAQQMRDLAVRKGVRHMVGLQARGAREFNRVRDLVAEDYVGKVLSCTMIITTPTWGNRIHA